MAPPRKPRRRHSSRAFTLVELLVVIGIIVVLIGILLPVVNSAVKSARAADSAAAISNLAKAIERYRQDFGAYPGPARNSAFTANGTAPNAGPDQFGGMTMTENMVVALLGGWEPNGGGGASYVMAKVGSGPITHTPVIAARKRYPAYADAVPGTTVQANFGGTWNRRAISQDSGNAYSSADRVDIPEFMDRFPDQMPIIYLRSQSGAPSYVGGKLGPNAQYDPKMILPYLKDSTTGFPANTEFPGSTNPPTRDFDSVERYFRNPGVGPDNDPTKWEVRQKDGFWLIGAGPDRKYGTKDDQTNFGPL